MSASTSQLNKTNLQSLDLLRGIAIIKVFFLHAIAASFNMIRLPWDGEWRSFDTTWAMRGLSIITLAPWGVAIFFTISGFCIHNSTLRSPPTGPVPFLTKIAFRLLPAYFCTLVIYALLGLLTQNPLVWKFLIIHIPLLQNLGPDYLRSINPPLWSIAVQVQLYVIYIMILTWRRHKPIKFLWISAILLEIAFRMPQIVGHPEASPLKLIPGLHNTPLNYLFSWTIGAQLAELWKNDRLPRISGKIVLAALALCYFTNIFRPLSYLNFTFSALFGAATICYLIHNHDRLGRSSLYVRLIKWSAPIALASFCIYLLHQAFLDATLAAIHKFSTQTLHPTILLCACILAFLPTYWAARFMHTHIESRFRLTR